MRQQCVVASILEGACAFEFRCCLSERLRPMRRPSRQTGPTRTSPKRGRPLPNSSTTTILRSWPKRSGTIAWRTPPAGNPTKMHPNARRPANSMLRSSRATQTPMKRGTPAAP
eukprot:8103703-Alexandrium_andersonii.AAC.1